MARYRSSYEGDRRSKSLRAWVTPAEYNALELAAAEVDTGISDYVRQICVRRLAGPAAVASAQRNPVAKVMADELRKIGIALTSLAREDRNNALKVDELPELMGALKAALTRVITL